MGLIVKVKRRIPSRSAILHLFPKEVLPPARGAPAVRTATTPRPRTHRCRRSSPKAAQHRLPPPGCSAAGTRRLTAAAQTAGASAGAPPPSSGNCHGLEFLGVLPARFFPSQARRSPHPSAVFGRPSALCGHVCSSGHQGALCLPAQASVGPLLLCHRCAISRHRAPQNIPWQGVASALEGFSQTLTRTIYAKLLAHNQH